MRKHTAVLTAAFLCAFLMVLAGMLYSAAAETLPAKHADALKYVRNQRPMDVSIETKSWTPKQLTELREALPDGAVFHFNCRWNGISFSDESVTLDLTGAQKELSETTLRQILALCPKLKLVDNSSHRNPSNDTFIPLIDEYPEIHFEWVVHLKGEHYCPTDATAYSTMNHTDYGARLKDEHMELLKYVPGLKALDVGHNAFTNLDFLRFFPDLELLIISNNEYVEDLTEVGRLSHLKYLEAHNTHVSDLTPLSGCTEMLDLNVSSTKVTDLSALDRITSLERFWANGLKRLPKEEQERFRSLHPDCTCDFTVNGSAISHKWRNHDRYYHFRLCFKHKTWEPFEASSGAAGN